MRNLTLSTVREVGSSLQVMGDGQITLFDQTGRFQFRTDGTEVTRRGLDNRVLTVRRVRKEGVDLREYNDLSESDKALLFTSAYAHALSALARPETQHLEVWRERIERWTPARLAEDAAAFSRVYLPISILPPDQYKSLVVQVAHGCSYNRCLFCDFYRDRPFHIKEPNELRAHLDGLLRFFGPRVEDRSEIFLADGNALVIPTEPLLEAMALIREALGAHRSFHTFMDTFNLDRKTGEELRRIRQAGLQNVYVGAESGSTRLRRFLRKPGDRVEVLEAIRQLKDAGFTVGVILLVGAGGPEYGEEHFAESMDLIQDAALGKNDLIYLSPFVTPDQTTGYEGVREAKGLEEFTEIQVTREVERWRNALRRESARVSTYPIREHIY